MENPGKKKKTMKKYQKRFVYIATKEYDMFPL